MLCQATALFPHYPHLFNLSLKRNIVYYPCYDRVIVIDGLKYDMQLVLRTMPSVPCWKNVRN
jgi:hypothetical protein